MNENKQGSLWLTSGGRVVLDNHNGEYFEEPYDKRLMTKAELKSGIKVGKLRRILNREVRRR